MAPSLSLSLCGKLRRFAFRCSCGRITTAARSLDHRVLIHFWNAALQKLLFPMTHLLSQGLEVYFRGPGLWKHLVFLFLNVMPNVLREDEELCIKVAFGAIHLIEFGDEQLGDVVLFVGLV